MSDKRAERRTDEFIELVNLALKHEGKVAATPEEAVLRQAFHEGYRRGLADGYADAHTKTSQPEAGVQ